jgi:hypothetical protein
MCAYTLNSLLRMDLTVDWKLGGNGTPVWGQSSNKHQHDSTSGLLPALVQSTSARLLTNFAREDLCII